MASSRETIMASGPDLHVKRLLSVLGGFMSSIMFTAESGFFAAARVREQVLSELAGAQSPADADNPPFPARHRGRRPARPTPGGRPSESRSQDLRPARTRNV
jgi:hypothetical protein